MTSKAALSGGFALQVFYMLTSVCLLENSILFSNMAHLISQHLTDGLTKGPSDTKTTQAKNMQVYIQKLLGDTHHTFLQGSYKNDTAISDINDVDIVAMRALTYSATHSPHGPFPSMINWEDIFQEIEEKLKKQTLYTWTVERGDKCIRVLGAFKADIVPSVQVGHDKLSDPIVVYSFRDMAEKINHPRDHYNNGVIKNSSTEGNYKPMVRMMKNWARNQFLEDRATVSSFKIEALVHGTPDNCFVNDRVISFILLADSIVKRVEAQSGILPSALSVCGREDICASWHPIARQNFTERLKESMGYAIEAYQATSQQVADEKWRLAFYL